MTFARYSLLVVALAAFGGVTHAGADTCAGKSPCAQPTAWNTAFDTIDISVPGTKRGDHARWRIEASSSTRDTTITVDQAAAGKRMQGTLAMVAGRVLITNGLELEQGYEIDAVDGPFLYALLTAQLLGRAFPDGPDTLKGTRKVNVTELRDGIRIGTPSASAEFAAPWTVIGTASKEKSGAVRFDLRFTSSDTAGAKQEKVKIRLTGSLGHAAVDPALPDDMPLQGWKVYGVGPSSRKQGDATIVDYGATADEKGYRTVAEIRKALAEESNPGAPDGTKDFTGFWKEACEQDFGLQIKPVEPGGMYSVSFCGPGGCFDPDTYRRNTYVSGDKSYEVVTQDEIKVRGSDGWSSYRKCSSDPSATSKP